MALTRRGLFSFFARGTAAAFAGGGIWKLATRNVFAGALPSRSKAPTNQRWVMVIDLAKCDGCADCTKACNKMHYVPPMQEWIKVYEVADNPTAGEYYMPRPCMHCDNPPCVRACPVGATYKRTTLTAIFSAASAIQRITSQQPLPTARTLTTSR